MGNFTIRGIAGKDVKQVVDIHIKAFPSFFLTFLGRGFLKEFYKSFLCDSQGVGFVAIDQETNDILGAIVGSLNPNGYFKRLLKRKWFAFCIASVGAVLRKPAVIKRLFRAVFYRGDAPDGQERSLLSSIAVSPDAQGRGVGKALVKRWLEEIKSRKSSGAFLTTDAENNQAVNSFYQNLGWKLESSYSTHEGRKMNRYVYNFN
ncbi:MAG: GNAT family N-acetyltransferase [Phycisphaerae bacterium]|jgi:ribosomal protein S18 acetylase RimI-like enzyme